MKFLILSGKFNTHNSHDIDSKHLTPLAVRFNNALINSSFVASNPTTFDSSVLINAKHDRLISILQDDSEFNLNDFNAIILFTNNTEESRSAIADLRTKYPHLIIISGVYSISKRYIRKIFQDYVASCNAHLLLCFNIDKENKLHTFVYEPSQYLYANTYDIDIAITAVLKHIMYTTSRKDLSDA